MADVYEHLLVEWLALRKIGHVCDRCQPGTPRRYRMFMDHLRSYLAAHDYDERFAWESGSGMFFDDDFLARVPLSFTLCHA
jgi:hypothetical protein